MLLGRCMRRSTAGMAVLQREVQVVADARVAGHDLDQAVGDVARVGIHQAQPAQLGRALQDGLHQPGQRSPAGRRSRP